MEKIASSPSIIVEEDEMGWSCSTNGENRNTYRLLVGKPEGRKETTRKTKT
jgi:hypothetical protein